MFRNIDIVVYTFYDFSFYAHNFITLRARTAQCIVIGPVCGFVTAGGRCPNLTTASARSVCVSLSAFFVLRLDALALSVIATATWLAGWLGGCLSQPVLYQND